LSAADTIKRMARSTITLKRVTADGYNADGLRVGPTTDSEDVRAVVQPVPASTLTHLPEGDQINYAISIWTTEVLKLGDRVTYQGVQYEILTKQDWADFSSGGKYVARNVR
jgi:hypothetical protein